MQLIYDKSDKHKDPWQPGRKGALCPKGIPDLDPQKMLTESILHKEKRYSVLNGVAYVAQCHQIQGGREYWHGYPEAWQYIPEKIRQKWINDGIIKKRQTRMYWNRDDLESIDE